MGIFFERVRSPIIGVTGTKGKSTTATLIALLLRSRFRRILLAGNIRKSVLDIMEDANRSTAVVLELSSFQLEDLALVKRSPNIAVITNIFPDHLNRHRTMREYRRVKSLIGAFQNEKDTIIVPKEIGIVKLLEKSRAKLISVAVAKTFRARVARINPALQGHMADAAALAIAAAQSMGIPEKDCLKQLAAFKPLEGRMEPVRVLRGVSFINDTTATTPMASAKGLALIRRRHRGVILIAGGSDKNLPYAEFGAAIKKSARFIFLLPGSATEKIIRTLGKWAENKSSRAASMEEAVRRASDMAERGETVLLSPGAASFGLFNHEFHRGSAFVSAVKKLA
ncbi:MAG: UDP-N-acetylmuramoylalanine--D-glutamate ligase [Candidatus Sungbacteria bacterium RIFCSPHIGHO2_02_FULL_49_12]|uniref:UDP-N-acetylmuramoylalanine--D-glutamate ligase n=1 Tax=Candidatus Sungbacteria bacterium RIFCSPHIGHO2_02_FULL_49_12 TaxID=1802271 RepID=A0A1G2KPL2_9BACT|nr:MAG: UDP-N-acetylmuramoylalanine--D-glutamate ligase [Candidatus Sungbacteria bacterium RIFCSPHIGHO2_02_FULL_49_12]